MLKLDATGLVHNETCRFLVLRIMCGNTLTNDTTKFVMDDDNDICDVLLNNTYFTPMAGLDDVAVMSCTALRLNVTSLQHFTADLQRNIEFLMTLV